MAEDAAQIAELLRGVHVFTELSEASLAELAQGASVDVLPAKTRISTTGESPQWLYALLEGVVRIFHEDEDSQVTVKQLSAPCTFAEKEVIADCEVVECTETVTQCRVIRIPPQRYTDALRSDTAATWHVLQDVCRRFCVAIRNEKALISPVPVRLASLLLAFADMFGARSPDGIKIKLALSQKDLADGVGGGLRSVSRTITDWTKRGWLKRHKGWIVIMDEEAMLGMAGSLRYNLNYTYTDWLQHEASEDDE